MTRTKIVLLAIALSGAMSLPAAAAKPGFACKGSLKAAERTICASNRLAALDQRMNGQYRALYVSLQGSDRAALRSDQRAWLSTRNGCGGSEYCLESEYLERINALAEWD